MPGAPLPSIPLSRALRFALVAALLAAPAAGVAEELLRWRTPDGREGIADDPTRLPAGAVVVSTRRRASGAALAAPAAERPAQEPAGRAAEPTRDDAGDEARPDVAPRCLAAGLDPGCGQEELDGVAGWRGRMRDARERRARAEERLAAERERWQRCHDALALVACHEGALREAEAEVARLAAEEQRVEDTCRREGCLPGWLEDAPGPDPEPESERSAASD